MGVVRQLAAGIRELAAALLIGLAVSVLLVALTVGALAVMDWYGTFTWMWPT